MMNRSLYTGFAFFCPFPVRGTWAAGDTHRGRLVECLIVWRAAQQRCRTSVHISFTFSSTILQCLSNALTRPSSLRLFRQLMSTWLG